jgi:hypothetical protein
MSCVSLRIFLSLLVHSESIANLGDAGSGCRHGDDDDTAARLVPPFAGPHQNKYFLL